MSPPQVTGAAIAFVLLWFPCLDLGGHGGVRNSLVSKALSFLLPIS